MLPRFSMYFGLALFCTVSPGMAQSLSPNGVNTLDPSGAISTAGDTWSVGSRAGDFIFVAGMQGINPATNKLVEGDEARIRQAFLNLKFIAQSEGATLQDCVRITVYLSDLRRFAPLVSKVQGELWASHLIRHEPCLRYNVSLMMTSLRSIVFFTLQQRSDRCPSNLSSEILWKIPTQWQECCRGMSSFDYNAPAELFLAKPAKGTKYRRFATAAEALRYAVEDLKTPKAFGAWLEVGDARFNSSEIQRLYEADEYPVAEV